MQDFSILFSKTNEDRPNEITAPPVFFADLNLDQLVAAVTAGKDYYNLKPFFYTPLNDADAIGYRQEVMRDLEDEGLMADIKSFADKMRTARSLIALAHKLRTKHNKEGWFLEAVETYCAAVSDLADLLTRRTPASRGLSEFRRFLVFYTESDDFTRLRAEIEHLKNLLKTVHYCLLIKGNTVKVRKYGSEADFSDEVEKTFHKFKQGAVKNYLVEYHTDAGMNNVEEKILECAALLYPEIFTRLDEFCESNGDFIEKTIAGFDREIQFYISYLDYIDRIKRTGLPFCFPEITCEDKEIYNFEGFDIVLAYNRALEKSPVIPNDFYLEGSERILVVSGPNQGGKTTFARSFGQIHYLASLGCPVPGRTARLFTADAIYTHFEKEETITNLRGKLKDDLVRLYTILEEATPRSIIILNEIFTSTTLLDAIFLSSRLMERIIELDLLCVWVTFITELSTAGEKTVSMVGSVNPDNPAERTFKIIRKPADGLSYAIAIAEKHGVTYESLKERIKI
jgi:DNA mismatch repair ATPase MutS